MNNLIVRLVTRLHSEDEGQTLVEYALILAFVSILSIAALGTLSDQINDVLGTVSDAL